MNVLSCKTELEEQEAVGTGRYHTPAPPSPQCFILYHVGAHEHRKGTLIWREDNKCYLLDDKTDFKTQAI